MGVDFREYGIPGLSVKTPANTRDFSRSVAAFLGGEPSGIAAAEMRWAMLVENRFGLDIVSMTTGMFFAGESSPGYTFFGTYPFRPGSLIKAGHSVLVLPEALFSPTEQIPTAEQTGLVEFERALGRASHVSVWIDGILFSDGSFYGLDESQMFVRLRRAVETYRTLFRLLAGKTQAEAIAALGEFVASSGSEDRSFEVRYGETRAFGQAVAAAKTGHLDRFLKTATVVVASVPEIHRGAQK